MFIFFNGFQILNKNGMIGRVTQSITRLTSYIELHYLRVWLQSRNDIQFTSFYQGFDIYFKSLYSFFQFKNRAPKLFCRNSIQQL